MKLALFGASGAPPRPGILLDDSLIDISHLVSAAGTPQGQMSALIDNFEGLKPALETAIQHSPRIELDRARLFAPLPRPGKLLNCIANYWEHAQRAPRPLNMFLKNPDAVIGPGDTIQLPDHTEPWAFMHEAELGLVIRGPAKNIAADQWRSTVFGYTCMIDVTARGEGRKTWRGGSWLGKSFDTFAPMGPCIVTADEIPDPNNLTIRFWNNGELRHSYHTDDMEHRVPELIEFATRIMTLNTGDVISCGTNHEGLGFLQDGEIVEIEIENIGRMKVDVKDPLKRQWPRGVYMGEDSTHHAAVKRYRPETVLYSSDASI